MHRQSPTRHSGYVFVPASGSLLLIQRRAGGVVDGGVVVGGWLVGVVVGGV